MDPFVPGARQNYGIGPPGNIVLSKGGAHIFNLPFPSSHTRSPYLVRSTPLVFSPPSH